MSASREKNKRREEQANGVDKRTSRAQAAAAAKKRSKCIGTVVAVVVVVALCALILLNSTLLYTGVTALKVGDWKFNNAQFNFEYFSECYSAYNNIYNTYGDYASYLLDLKSPLDEQNFSEDMTWEQYFEDSAIDKLTQVAALWDAGHAEGFEESASLASSVESAIDATRSNAVSAGFPTFRQYLGQMYGKGANEKVMRDMLTKGNYAAEYSLKLLDEWKAGFTAEELDEYYEGVADDYDVLKYCRFYATDVEPEAEVEPEADVEPEAEVEPEAALSAAERAAKVAEATDENTFYFNVLTNCAEGESEMYADPTSVFYSTTPAGLGNEEWAAWFTDPARQYGDTTVFESGDGYYTMMYLSLEHNDYNMENFHVIRLDVEPDENGAITQEQTDARKVTVDSVVEQYLADPTVANFEWLAGEYSQDAASLDAGGRYENVAMGAFGNDDVDAYVFDEARVEGDCEVIESGSSFYIVLMDAEGGNYKDYIASELLAVDNYNAMMDSLAADYPVTTTAAFRFAK